MKKTAFLFAATLVLLSAASTTWAQGDPPATQPVTGQIAPPPKKPAKEVAPKTARAAADTPPADTTPGALPKFLSHPEVTGDNQAPTRFTSPQAAVPPAIAEALGILAEIAVDKAKQQGLTLLQAQLEKDVCGLVATAKTKPETAPSSASAPPPKPTADPIPLFPNTCSLIKNSSLERLVGDPNAVAHSVTEDLLGDLKLVFDQIDQDTANSGIATVLGVATDVAVRAVARNQPAFTVDDAWAIASTIVNGPLVNAVDEGTKSTAVGLALHAVRICLDPANATKSCDVVGNLDGLKLAVNDGRYREAIDLAVDASRMLFAQTSQSVGGGTSPDPKERLRAAVTLARKIAHSVATATCTQPPHQCAPVLSRIDLVGDVLEAAVDENQPKLISSGADLLVALLDANDTTAKVALKKTTLVLTAVSEYAATFNGTPTADQAKALHDSRKEILESVIDAATDRGNRAHEWVSSVGSSVGFALRLKSDVWDHPQLALPMGFAVQYLPGTAGKPDEWGVGFHLMLSVIDLGQFLGYDASGGTPSPTWDTAVAPGAQIGLLLGPAANAFVVGVDGRYARDPLDATGKHTAQISAFAAYYVSFFDFN